MPPILPFLIPLLATVGTVGTGAAAGGGLVGGLTAIGAAVTGGALSSTAAAIAGGVTVATSVAATVAGGIQAFSKPKAEDDFSSSANAAAYASRQRAITRQRAAFGHAASRMVRSSAPAPALGGANLLGPSGGVQ